MKPEGNWYVATCDHCGWERAETTGMRGIAAEITHRDKCKGAKE